MSVNLFGQCVQGSKIQTLQISLPVVHGWNENTLNICPDNKVHVANMGPIWGRQGPGGPHVGPMNFAIWVIKTFG